MINYLHEVQLAQQPLHQAAGTMLQMGQMLDRKQDRIDAKAERDEEKRQLELRRAKAEEERQAAIQDRTDEREAEYAMMQGVDHIKNGWNGVDTVDENGKTVHNPGVVDRTWQQMRDAETDPVKEMERLKKEVYDSDFYRKLSTTQKEKFERKFIFKKSEFARAASLQHGKLTVQRNKEETEQMVAWNGQRVSETFGSTDDVYAKTARWAVSQNFKYAMGTAIENPEIFDDPAADFTKKEAFDAIKWRGKPSEAELALRRKALVDMAVEYDKGRIKALTDAASSDRCFDGNPELNTPEKCIAKAAMLANGLNGNLYGLDKDGKKINPGPEMITDAERNALLDQVEKAQASMFSVRSQAQRKNFLQLGAEIQQMSMDTKDPKKAESCTIDFDGQLAKLSQAVGSRSIDANQAKRLLKDYQQYARNVFYNREDAILDEKDPAKRRAMYLAEAQQFKNGDPRFYKVICGIANKSYMGGIGGDKVLTRDLKAKTQYCLYPPRNATQEQMEAWIDQRRSLEYEYREAFESGALKPEDFKQIRADLNTSYNEEDQRAVEFFDGKFGLDRTKGYQSSADVTRTLETRKTPYGEKFRDIKITWDGTEYEIDWDKFRDYRARFLDNLKQLRESNPTASSTKLAEESYQMIKSLYVEDNAKLILGGIKLLDGGETSGLGQVLDRVRSEDNARGARVKSEIASMYPQSVRDLAPSLVDLDEGKKEDEEMGEVIK